MGKTKVFKCPKCDQILTLKIELPPNVKRWPFIFKVPHKNAAGDACVVVLGIDPNYQIREVGRSDMKPDT
ncbi:MAG: hypothetical protein ACTSRW_02100 [Candidatus Helarchaeota archaeon]